MPAIRQVCPLVLCLLVWNFLTAARLLIVGLHKSLLSAKLGQLIFITPWKVAWVVWSPEPHYSPLPFAVFLGRNCGVHMFRGPREPPLSLVAPLTRFQEEALIGPACKCPLEKIALCRVGSLSQCISCNVFQFRETSCMIKDQKMYLGSSLWDPD